MFPLRPLAVCSLVLLTACNTAPTEPEPSYRLTMIDKTGQRQTLNVEALKQNAAAFSSGVVTRVPNSNLVIGERGEMYQLLPQGALNLHTGQYYQRYLNGYLDTQTGIFYQEASGGYFFDTQNGGYVRP